MIPADYRNLTFAEIQGRITGKRLDVLNALRTHGAATTRGLAEAMRMDLLSVRPRLTELYQLGFVRLLEREGHEGTYEALTGVEARAEFARRQAAAFGPEERQMSLFAEN